MKTPIKIVPQDSVPYASPSVGDVYQSSSGHLMFCLVAGTWLDAVALLAENEAFKTESARLRKALEDIYEVSGDEISIFTSLEETHKAIAGAALIYPETMDDVI